MNGRAHQRIHLVLGGISAYLLEQTLCLARRCNHHQFLQAFLCYL